MHEAFKIAGASAGAADNLEEVSSIVGAELSFFGSCFLLKNDAYMKYRLEPLAGRDGGLRARNADPLGWRAQVLKGKPLTSMAGSDLGKTCWDNRSQSQSIPFIAGIFSRVHLGR